MYFRIFLCVFGLFFSACFDGDTKSKIEEKQKQIPKKEDNITQEDLEQNLLKNKLKEEQKIRLEELSQELHNKQKIENIKSSPYGEGLKKHTEFFENFYHRKDLPKNATKNNPQNFLDKAYEHQKTQIERLRKEQDRVN
ncbi:hypothetical protein B6S12_02370 [Helicobacter valdiviensis]|uniref:Lipoprotein n=1 Tax=Helicobacter valdiviensis TaxID=1458358 RepID=A0A2W6MZD3_9HELI|nr:hypothetical protein [Helicobacter valdiviensis]PZT48708.1 hypothetical protein B6S12_02370 [Helicobacter valdiviensis]